MYYRLSVITVFIRGTYSLRSFLWKDVVHDVTYVRTTLPLRNISRYQRRNRFSLRRLVLQVKTNCFESRVLRCTAFPRLQYRFVEIFSGLVFQLFRGHIRFLMLRIAFTHQSTWQKKYYFPIWEGGVWRRASELICASILMRYCLLLLFLCCLHPRRQHFQVVRYSND